MQPHNGLTQSSTAMPLISSQLPPSDGIHTKTSQSTIVRKPPSSSSDANPRNVHPRLSPMTMTSHDTDPHLTPEELRSREYSSDEEDILGIASQTPRTPEVSQDRSSLWNLLRTSVSRSSVSKISLGQKLKRIGSAFFRRFKSSNIQELQVEGGSHRLSDVGCFAEPSLNTIHSTLARVY